MKRRDFPEKEHFFPFEPQIFSSNAPNTNARNRLLMNDRQFRWINEEDFRLMNIHVEIFAIAPSANRIVDTSSQLVNAAIQRSTAVAIDQIFFFDHCPTE